MKMAKKKKKKEPELLDSLLSIYVGKIVKVKLTNGETLEGRIYAIARYDFILETEDKRYLLIFKHSIKYVEKVGD